MGILLARILNRRKRDALEESVRAARIGAGGAWQIRMANATGVAARS